MDKIPNVFDIAERDDLIALYIGDDESVSDDEIDELFNEGRAMLEERGDDAKLKALGRLMIQKGDMQKTEEMLTQINDKDVAQSLAQQITDAGGKLTGTKSKEE